MAKWKDSASAKKIWYLVSFPKILVLKYGNRSKEKKNKPALHLLFSEGWTLG